MLCVGLLSGGYGQDELVRAGAFRVFRDTADLHNYRTSWASWLEGWHRRAVALVRIARDRRKLDRLRHCA